MPVLPHLLLTFALCTGTLVCGVLQWSNSLQMPWTGRSDLVNHMEAYRHKRATSQSLECKNGYEDVDGSTMCLTDSPDYIKGSAGVSDADKQVILDEHNTFRAVVVPPASHMMKVYWNDELAKVAEKWAKQCIIGHDTAKGRYIPIHGLSSGQNSAYNMDSWKSVIRAWFSEVSLFRYGIRPDTYLGQHGQSNIGHYSMIATDEAHLIGCGFAKCATKTETFYVCNYAVVADLVAFPYRVGIPCSGCPSKCTRNLCDCGGRFCFNGGKLNLETCTCTCKFTYQGDQCLIDPCNRKSCINEGMINTSTCKCQCPYPYQGEYCEEKQCDVRPDPDSCLLRKIEYCQFRIVKKDCPLLCKVCPVPCPGLFCINGFKDPTTCQCIYPCADKSCKNKGKLNLDTCMCECTYPYIGDTCEKLQCTGKSDNAFCVVFWPNYLCYMSQISSRCPVMCGICTGPCKDLVCLNQGLKTPSCKCYCPYPFSGASCEIKQCSQELDPRDCGTIWPEKFCARFSNVRVFCPAMCGTCPAVCGGKLCQNGGHLNMNTCECSCPKEYMGDRCEEKRCNDKECKNYGIMNYDMCYCSCPPNWTGDICDQWACPATDPTECGTSAIPSFRCFTHWDVPFICPIMCGECPRNPETATQQ